MTPFETATQATLTAGVDEAGRGPLAGPVVVAAVILPVEYDLKFLDDSKRLTALKRERLLPQIEAQAIAFAVEFVTPEAKGRRKTGTDTGPCHD